jgi:protein-tyrosine phosphatase
MVDIHCHILPGLDDGADSFDESVQMAETAIADGITHVVGTPHASDQFRFDAALTRQRCQELQQRVGDGLTLETGCDFHLNYENVRDLRVDPRKYTIAQKNYLLVELNDYAIPPNIQQMLHDLRLIGLLPIITHPERNPLIQRRQDYLRQWLHQGCYVQITAMSFLGKFGSQAEKAAWSWLDSDMVHFVASDAHNTTRRPLRLRQAFEAVAVRRGASVAQALFTDNPLAALEGRPLPYEPEQPEVASRSRRRKRFSFF